MSPSARDTHFVLIDHVVPRQGLELLVEPRIGFEVQNPQSGSRYRLAEALEERVEERRLTEGRSDPQLQNSL